MRTTIGVSHCLTACLMALLLGCRPSPEAKARAEAKAKQCADHIAKLKTYVPPDVLKTVDPEFYTYAGFRDWWRFPLVYPYSIHCIDTLDSGRLCRHDGKSKISSGEEDQIQGLEKLTALSFDAHFLIGHMESEAADSHTGKRIRPWILVDFATGKIESFAGQEELTAAAKARGYAGEVELAGIRTRYEECFP